MEVSVDDAAVKPAGDGGYVLRTEAVPRLDVYKRQHQPRVVRHHLIVVGAAVIIHIQAVFPVCAGDVGGEVQYGKADLTVIIVGLREREALPFAADHAAQKIHQNGGIIVLVDVQAHREAGVLYYGDVYKRQDKDARRSSAEAG